MRSLPVFILFGFFVVLIHSRPSQTDENNESINIEDTEYVESKSDDDSPESDARLEESAESENVQSGRIDMNKNAYSFEQGNIADHTNTDIPDLKTDGNRDFRNYKADDYADMQNNNQHHQATYLDNKDPLDQQDANQRLMARNLNYPKNKQTHNNMLFGDPLNKMESEQKKGSLNLQGEMLFRTGAQVDNDFFHEPMELNKPYSRYYGQKQPVNREISTQAKNRNFDHVYFNRERRESNDPILNEKESDSNQNEDDETAIKKHITKLSSDELEELLSSLTEEKRELLKSIIDDAELIPNTIDLNKREIRKKTGSVAENSCIESGQADSNISGDSVASDSDEEKTTESPLLTTVYTEANKETESQSDNIINLETNTESNSDSKVSLSERVDAGQKIVDDASIVSTKKNSKADAPEKSTADLVPSDEKILVQMVPSPAASKNENKRETNLEDLADIVSFDDSNMKENDWLSEDTKDQSFCSHDNVLSQFIDEDQLTANEGSKMYKRDLQADCDAKMKSLEESFPKSSSYDEVTGPLIRVKRRNEPEMKKRAAGVLPDSKVSFFPYRAENDDEDNDEGNEFDDDGFYDRTPNFSSNDKLHLRDALACESNVDHSRSSKDGIKDTSNLGSDTDSVLSGVEGEDENLMFSSGSRSKRTTEDISDILDDSNSIHSSKSLGDEEPKTLTNRNLMTYQESDSFGPLPRNNEGETGRYKRIRRVKQSHPEGISDS